MHATIYNHTLVHTTSSSYSLDGEGEGEEESPWNIHLQLGGLGKRTKAPGNNFRPGEPLSGNRSLLHHVLPRTQKDRHRKGVAHCNHSCHSFISISRRKEQGRLTEGYEEWAENVPRGWISGCTLSSSSLFIIIIHTYISHSARGDWTLIERKRHFGFPTK